MSGTHGRGDAWAVVLAVVTFAAVLVVLGVMAQALLGYLAGMDSSGTVGSWNFVLGYVMPVLGVIGSVGFLIWWGQNNG